MRKKIIKYTNEDGGHRTQHSKNAGAQITFSEAPLHLLLSFSSSFSTHTYTTHTPPLPHSALHLRNTTAQCVWVCVCMCVQIFNVCVCGCDGGVLLIKWLQQRNRDISFEQERLQPLLVWVLVHYRKLLGWESGGEGQIRSIPYCCQSCDGLPITRQGRVVGGAVQ